MLGPGLLNAGDGFDELLFAVDQLLGACLDVGGELGFPLDEKLYLLAGQMDLGFELGDEVATLLKTLFVVFVRFLQAGEPALLHGTLAAELLKVGQGMIFPVGNGRELVA